MEVGKFILFDRGADQVDSIFLTAERRSTFSDFYRRLVPVPTDFQRNHRPFVMAIGCKYLLVCRDSNHLSFNDKTLTGGNVYFANRGELRVEGD